MARPKATGRQPATQRSSRAKRSNTKLSGVPPVQKFSSGEKPARARAKRSTATAASTRRQYLPADERRRHILAAAREVFARAGLKGARTRELARAAGINQATLFEHFASKEALFTAAVTQPLAANLEEARDRAEYYAGAAAPVDLLPLLDVGIRQHLDNMVEIYPLLAQALFSDRAMGEAFYREHIAPMLEERATINRHFIKAGLDARLVQLASFGMFFAIAMDQAMTGKSLKMKQTTAQLTELILYGCTAAAKSE